MLTLVISETGEIYAATNATIVNNSTDMVKVTEVQLTADNGWTIVPYATNMANEQVDTKLIGFQVNGAESVYSGYMENLSLNSGWNIGKNDSMERIASGC